MRHFARTISADVVIVLALVAFQQPPNRTAQSEKKAPGTVTGKVTLDGEPVRKARVVLSPDSTSAGQGSGGESFTALTNSDGTFRISGVQPGRFVLRVVATVGFLLPDSSKSQGRTMIVHESEELAVDLELVRGGVITGKVTEFDGTPLIGLEVSASPVPGGSTPEWMWSTSPTDDRGVYRIFNLPAARYTIHILPRGSINNGMPTFYPGVTDRTKAATVTVVAESETRDVDIKLEEVGNSYSVSGQVVDGESGDPVSGVTVSFTNPRGEDWRRPVGGKTGPNGTFVFNDVTPGRYKALVRNEANGDRFSDSVDFEVVAADVTGVNVTLRRGSSISGRLVIEGELAPAAREALSKGLISIRATRRDEVSGIYMHAGIAKVAADGTFRINGLDQGRFLLNLSVNSPEPLNIGRIDGSGLIVNQIIELAHGQSISELLVTAAYGSGSVFGQVKFLGSVPVGARLDVRLEPVDSRLPLLRFGAIDVSQSGHFRVERVTPGQYRVVAILMLPMGSRPQPTPFVKQPVVVKYGEKTEVTVPFDLSTLK